MLPTRAVVVGCGVVSALGVGALENGFLYRASHPAMRESALLDSFDQPVTMCTLPTLDPLLHGAERALQLGRAALHSAFEPLGMRAASVRLKLGLCLDDWASVPDLDGPGAARLIGGSLHRDLCQLGNDRAGCEILPDGPAAAGRLLARALAELAEGAAEIALLGGVHTDYSPAIVRQLEAEGRLFTSENLDAFIPGECAAFVALMSEAAARRAGLPALARIHAISGAWERAKPDNDESAYEAAALTVALRKATEALDPERERIGWLLSDASFELRELYEWQAVTIRTRRCFGEPGFADFPAQRLGQLGAAALPLMLSLAAVGFYHGYAPHERAALLVGSDNGERAVLVASRGNQLQDGDG